MLISAKQFTMQTLIKLAQLSAVGLLTILSNCSTVKVSKAPFGSTSDGTSVDLYTLENSNGMKATITNYGGIVLSFMFQIKMEI